MSFIISRIASDDTSGSSQSELKIAFLEKRSGRCLQSDLSAQLLQVSRQWALLRQFLKNPVGFKVTLVFGQKFYSALKGSEALLPSLDRLEVVLHSSVAGVVLVELFDLR